MKLSRTIIVLLRIDSVILKLELLDPVYLINLINGCASLKIDHRPVSFGHDYLKRTVCLAELLLTNPNRRVGELPIHNQCPFLNIMRRFRLLIYSLTPTSVTEVVYCHYLRVGNWRSFSLIYCQYTIFQTVFIS